MKKTSRRKFLQSSAAISAGSLLVSSSIQSVFASELNNGGIHSHFKQDALAYAYTALEPSIDALTMEIHYTKHAAAYCKALNEAAHTEHTAENITIEAILKGISKYSAKMRNNAGGHYNHELFWKCLSPNATMPSAKLTAAINSQFGSIDAFKTAFTEAAKSRFGSGWAWLVISADKKLSISSTPNQDNPLMDIAETKGNPLFGLDVWEHAYYLKYQNKRADYIDNFWKILNWDFVSTRFDKI